MMRVYIIKTYSGKCDKLADAIRAARKIRDAYEQLFFEICSRVRAGIGTSNLLTFSVKDEGDEVIVHEFGAERKEGDLYHLLRDSEGKPYIEVPEVTET
jgi:glutamate/tyrosine decarboxylase-like PLP-dependent enzyme